MSGTSRLFSASLVAVAALASSACAGIVGAPKTDAQQLLLSSTAFEFQSDASLFSARLPLVEGAAAKDAISADSGADSRAPGGLALVLSALGSLGAFRGLRAAKRLPLGDHAPDWYHAEGPRQIGHATALDLSQLSTITPAAFEPRRLIEPDSRSWLADTLALSSPQLLFACPVRSPRAPPQR